MRSKKIIYSRTNNEQNNKKVAPSLLGHNLNVHIHNLNVHIIAEFYKSALLLFMHKNTEIYIFFDRNGLTKKTIQ